ncbi:leucine-rich repeat protein [Hoylesella timonensis]|uniref:leucine-rich repeat protein n=1 Tax=Hoylesella timonensis TaxID=386414 RepID=UPI003AF7A9CA
MIVFLGCKYLEPMVFPYSLREISNFSFIRCMRKGIHFSVYLSTNEKALFYPHGLIYRNFYVNLLQQIGYMAFENCESILYARYHSNSKVDSSTLINCLISQEKSHE